MQLLWAGKQQGQAAVKGVLETQLTSRGIIHALELTSCFFEMRPDVKIYIKKPHPFFLNNFMYLRWTEKLRKILRGFGFAFKEDSAEINSFTIGYYNLKYMLRFSQMYKEYPVSVLPLLNVRNYKIQRRNCVYLFIYSSME